MRLILVALLFAISYAQTGVIGNCEPMFTPETCSGVGDDGAPCRWHFGDNKCKEDTGGFEGYPAVTTSTGTTSTGTGTTTTGTTTTGTTTTGTTTTGTSTASTYAYQYQADGCEEFPETSCSTQTGENGLGCHWVVGEGCKKADCEHFLVSENCVGKTGEHGRACQWFLDEGCEETIGVDGTMGLEIDYNEGCESYGVETCSANTGENGVACHWYQNECKESNCEHYYTEADCNVATSDASETCAWNLGDGCKEATDRTEPHCDYYTETTCTGATGEAGKQCYWNQYENNGVGKCDEDNETELPGLLRITHQNKEVSSPSAWLFAGVFFGTFFLTAGITFIVLKKCSVTPSEDINLSYRAVV